MVKLHIKKGDTVYVNSGENKGATGKVLSVDREKMRAVVEYYVNWKFHGAPPSPCPAYAKRKSNEKQSGKRTNGREPHPRPVRASPPGRPPCRP